MAFGRLLTIKDVPFMCSHVGCVKSNSFSFDVVSCGSMVVGRVQSPVPVDGLGMVLTLAIDV